MAKSKAKREELYKTENVSLTSHATGNIRQRVETMSRKRERTHWLTPLCQKDS